MYHRVGQGSGYLPLNPGDSFNRYIQSIWQSTALKRDGATTQTQDYHRCLISMKYDINIATQLCVIALGSVRELLFTPVYYETSFH
jgi:hypothetical protein